MSVAAHWLVSAAGERRFERDFERAAADRLFVIGKDGKIAYSGGPGPSGFLPHEMEAALKKELEKGTAAR